MTPPKVRLAKNLNFYQKHNQISNRKLAEKAKVSESVVAQYRNAKTEEPDLKIIRKIAEALEITVSDLLKED
jgi:transcriptional regulator with XRE-family HTH domain